VTGLCDGHPQRCDLSGLCSKLPTDWHSRGSSIRRGKAERNDRIFVIPDRPPFEGDLRNLRHLPKKAIAELEKFFWATDALGTKKLKFIGWHGSRKAVTAIKKTAQ
jgi:inorganic pyrophosphatase